MYNTPGHGRSCRAREEHKSSTRSVPSPLQLVKVLKETNWKRAPQASDLNTTSVIHYPIILREIYCLFYIIKSVRKMQHWYLNCTQLWCRWNKSQISNWSSEGYPKCVQFYNCFRLQYTRRNIKYSQLEYCGHWPSGKVESVLTGRHFRMHSIGCIPK